MTSLSVMSILVVGPFMTSLMFHDTIPEVYGVVGADLFCFNVTAVCCSPVAYTKCFTPVLAEWMLYS
jgi:hypothetical protein